MSERPTDKKPANDPSWDQDLNWDQFDWAEVEAPPPDEPARFDRERFDVDRFPKVDDDA